MVASKMKYKSEPERVGLQAGSWKFRGQMCRRMSANFAMVHPEIKSEYFAGVPKEQSCSAAGETCRSVS
jgi:hypothetical protein